MTFLKILTFVAAFLLFQIELIIGRILLPNFGGSYLVWGSCVVFFQATLLLGYVYAHVVVRKFGIERYRKFHFLLLVFPLFLFPGHALALRYEPLGLPLVLEVFRVLILTIGPVFFVLSTMSLLTQAWLSHSSLQERKNPYALFAVSNLGSFTALLTYPFVFELFMDLKIQQLIWWGLYGVLVVVSVLAYRWVPATTDLKVKQSQQKPFSPITLWQWFCYGVAGVMIFLSVTNILTLKMAPMPLLWMLPLAVYLLSFILNFKAKRWCPKWIPRSIDFAMSIGFALYLVLIKIRVPFYVEMVLFLSFCFVVCMFIQNQLYSSKPTNDEQLTSFYVVISLGGFIGGVLASWVMPLLSTTFLEYFVGLFFLALAWEMDQKKQGPVWRLGAWLIILMVVFLLAPLFHKRMLLWEVLVFILVITAITAQLRKLPRGITSACLLIALLNPWIESNWSKERAFFNHRNYYGIIQIYDNSSLRFLVNNTVIHGAEFLDEQRYYVPLTYYNPKSPAALILINEHAVKHVGIIGLGAGSLGPYLTAGQTLDYFELDPDVVKVANKYFRFLQVTKAPMRFLIGDARQSFGKPLDKKYDVLVVDAFSGDYIPTQLLTKEALSGYQNHLSERGVIIFHITNHYVNLVPPLFKTAQSIGAHFVTKDNIDFISNGFFSNWVAVTWNDDMYRKLITRYEWKDVNSGDYESVRPWSDSYTTIIPYLDFAK